jgi:hypothetical protein
MPTCFKCKKQLPSIKDLCHHLRQIHLLYEPTNLSCAEDGCCRTFSRFNSFYRHLSTCHACHVSATTATASSSLLVESVATDYSVNMTEHFDTSGIEPNFDGQVSASTEAGISNASFDMNDVKLHAANFLLSLTTCSSMTLSQVDFVRSSVAELVTAIIDKVKEQSSVLLDELPSAVNVKSSFMHQLDRLSCPFDGVESVYKLEKYVAQSSSYVAPNEIVLGQHWESSNLQQEQRQKNDNMIYVPIKSTLQQLLRWKKCWNEMIDVNEGDGIEISSYFCGSNFKKNYARMKEANKTEFFPLIIQLYYDDFEPANPIGSKSGFHKLGAFYFTLLNFKREHNSKLENIHLVALVYRQDIAKYGMPHVLAPLQSELKDLECGFNVLLEDGSCRHVICMLGNVVADNLGLHGILGYTRKAENIANQTQSFQESS